jgi:RimJ/RimL family protein N-acetyltransferase
MFHKEQKFSKLKIILSIFILLGIATTIYIFIPKNKSKIEKIKSFELSQPDSRPNEITGETVTLKRLNPEYFPEYFEKINYPQVLKPLYFPSKLTFQWIKEYLDEEFDRERNRQTFLYLIFNNKNNELVGSIEIREQNPKDPGQFGCWITPKYWGKGKLQEAFNLIINAYFKLKPDVKNFNAHVEMWNLRSYYALKKCGFKLIKTLHFKNQPSRYLLEYYNPNIN